MKAYQNGITKEQFVAEVRKHRKLDHYVQGSYWNSGKGCAVGCAVESINFLKGTDIKHNDHYECGQALGIPEWLERLQDTIFEGLTTADSKDWPLNFSKAINEGADLEQSRVPIILMLLEHTLVSMDGCKYDADKWPEVKKAIEQSKSAVKQMIDAQKSKDEEQINAAWSAAESAAESAWSAAESAAGSARSAARSARSAARSAAWSARSAGSARSARSAARSAAWSARSARSAAWSAAWSARSARSAAWSAAYKYYADRIVEILKDTR